LTVNIVACVVAFLGAVMNNQNLSPLKPVQLLWLNLIMDVLAALALATEHPDDMSLTRDPVFTQAPLISNKMRCFIAVHSLFQMAMILAIIFVGHEWFNIVAGGSECDQAFSRILSNVTNPTTNVTTEELVEDPIQTACRLTCKHQDGVYDGRYCQQGKVHSTIIFNCFIWMQIFNIFNARKLFGEMNPLEGLWSRSQLLVRVFLVIVGFQIFAVEVATSFIGTTPLRWDYWLISIGFGACEIIVGIVQRSYARQHPCIDSGETTCGTASAR
jgi:magnesium-transporting ATPase (P-type)